MDMMMLRRQCLAYSPGTLMTASGNPVVFDTKLKRNLAECKVHFSPVQEGTGDPSPTNVRPITGWTGCEVHRAGKNLIDKNALTGTSSVWWNGKVIGGYPNPPHCVTPKIPVKPGTQYYLKRDGGNQNYISMFDKNGDFLRQVAYSSNGAKITMPDDVCFVGITIAVAAADSAQLEVGSEATTYEPYQSETVIPITFPLIANILSTTTITANKTLNASGGIINENGMSVTDFIKVQEGDLYRLTFLSKEAGRTRRIYGYDSNKDPVQSLAHASWVVVDTEGTVQATIPSGVDYIRVCYKTADVNVFLEGPTSKTVYGGYVDLTSGEVWETHKRINLPVSEKQGTWDSATGKGAYWYTSGIQNLETENDGVLCNRCRVQSAVSTSDTESVIKWYTNGVIRWVDIGAMGMTVTEYREYLAENPLQVTYKLTSPVLVATLTPQQIKTLRGINTVWSNTNGTIDLSYWK